MQSNGKIEQFKTKFNESLNSIEQYRKDCSDMSELVEWLLTTDANEYSYLGDDYGSYVNTAESFVALLDAIHHAIHDDGDINFVSVNGEPRIVFANRYEPDFRDSVLSKQEQRRERECNSEKYKVEILEITANEFGSVYDEFWAERLKKGFMFDAARFHLDYAVNHYRQYKCFSDEWIKEFENKK